MEICLKAIQDATRDIAEVMREGSKWEGFGKKHDAANESGDHQETVDVVADNIMSAALDKCDVVGAYASEEKKDITDKANRGSLFVAFDPLDGSQNIAVNITTGMIFGIWNRPETSLGGRGLIAAGYAIFGAATQLIVCRKNVRGAEILTLHGGEFHSVKQNHIIPSKGKVYACNEGLQSTWVVEHSRKFAEQNRGKSVRWMACMVSDAHRILMDGGSFLLPADKKNKRGKLRLLYEAYPMAFVFEQCGGVASFEDHSPILDHPFPSDNLHLKVPVFLSSPTEAAVYSKL
eukprot:TRINITY_DN23368_c0_g1_i1.p1 TRINITY_DN23368_c0_g1~~TRINITY_DN23368_c0_g1_i1.p1  ORF type:complete len:290 (+),score=50.23 TRINITY_DN23368_c0_g1_i1:59-928(+)